MGNSTRRTLHTASTAIPSKVYREHVQEIMDQLDVESLAGTQFAPVTQLAQDILQQQPVKKKVKKATETATEEPAAEAEVHIYIHIIYI